MVSLSPLTLFFLFLLLTHLLTKMAKQQAGQYSQSLKPPSPPGLPIVGHLHLLTDMPPLKQHVKFPLEQKYEKIVYILQREQI